MKDLKQITLANLGDSTAQEVFDWVATHLLTQGKRCEAAHGCMYRYGDLKCAAGACIADDEYDEEIEDYSWNLLIFKGLVSTAHASLITELQAVHDKTSPEEWQSWLLVVATTFHLNTEVLQNV